jgi:hypothetical protein
VVDAYLILTDTLSPNPINNSLGDLENRSNLGESPPCGEFIVNDRREGENIRTARWGRKIGWAAAQGSSVAHSKLCPSAGLNEIQWKRSEKDGAASRHAKNQVEHV